AGCRHQVTESLIRLCGIVSGQGIPALLQFGSRESHAGPAPQVPYQSRSVPATRRGQQPAIRREVHRGDVSFVPPESAAFLAGGRFPEEEVGPARGQRPAIRRKGQVPYPFFWFFRTPALLSCHRVPQADYT